MNDTWIEKQEKLIASLQSQPFIILIRPKKTDFNTLKGREQLLSLIERFYQEGVQHIELAWSANPNWLNFMNEIKLSFQDILLGAASIQSHSALKDVETVGFTYAMSPFWDEKLQKRARTNKQILIPGVFSPTEIHRAKSFGYKIIKVFPAVILGEDFVNQLQGPLDPLPFIIAAGGLKVSDIKPWLSKGYGALVLGRSLIKKGIVDPKLHDLLQEATFKIN